MIVCFFSQVTKAVLKPTQACIQITCLMLKDELIIIDSFIYIAVPNQSWILSFRLKEFQILMRQNLFKICGQSYQNFINCICNNPSVWQSVWVFIRLMQISPFKIEISLFINRDISISR